MDPLEGRQALIEVHNILLDLKITHFLILGTALGAYRDNGFVPGEKDIDIGFLAEKFYWQAGRIVDRLINVGFECRTVNKPFEKCRAIKANRGSVKLDLVAYILWKDKRFCTSSIEEYSIVHDRKMLERYEEVRLFNETFLIPSPIEQYLELEYGPDWRVPQNDNRSRTRVYGFRRSEGIPDDYF